MARIIWSPRASREWESILTTIGREAGSAVRLKWKRKFDKAVNALVQFPEIGSPVEDFGIGGLREQIVGPYRIIYVFTGTECRISRFLRAEQDLDLADFL